MNHQMGTHLLIVYNHCKLVPKQYASAIESDLLRATVPGGVSCLNQLIMYIFIICLTLFYGGNCSYSPGSIDISITFGAVAPHYILLIPAAYDGISLELARCH